MLRIVRLSDNEIVGIADVIDVQQDGYGSVDDMLHRLMQAQADGLIKIEPDAESLQRLAVRAAVERYTARDRAEDGARRFIPDRRGGRINRTAARFAELDAVNRAESIRSIQRYMSLEGPAAYRSQAQLLGILDPTADAELIARQASAAVGDAVRTGISEGRAMAAPDEMTG